jgi:hypothetical protein
VTNGLGVATVGSVDVVVRNMLPLGAISASPASPKAGEPTQLSAIGSVDPDGTITRYQWDLDGDGSYDDRDTGATPSTSTTFANHGSVTVGVRVTDDDGGTGTKTLSIGVLRAEEPDDGPGDGGDGDGGDKPVRPATGGGADGDPLTPDAPPPPGDPAPEVVNPERPFGAWLGGTAMQRTKQVLARGVLLSCRSEVAAWCSLRVTVGARDAKRLKLGRKAVTVGRSALPVAEGQSARKRIKLSARARRALRGANGVRLLVSAVARSGDGREVELSRVVLLRR